MLPVLVFGVLYLAALVCLSVLLGGVCFLVAYLVTRKRQFKGRWLLIILSTLTPAIFIFSELFISLVAAPIVSEKYGVDWGYGDYWKAPLNETYCVSAVDDPETAHIGIPFGDGCSVYDKVAHIWIMDDDIYVGGNKPSGQHTLYVFHQPNGCDSIVCTTDSLLYERALLERGLVYDQAFSAPDYFGRTQREAHKVERPLRHLIVGLILLMLWSGLILYIKKNQKP